MEFEVQASLEMPSLCIELDDDDCNVEQADGLSFAIPVGKIMIYVDLVTSTSYLTIVVLFYSGDILTCRPNLYDCTLPLTTTVSNRQEKVYTRSFNLLNIRQSTIPFELTVSDCSFLSIEPTTLTTLLPQSKVNVQCHLHLTQDLIDRFQSDRICHDESSSEKSIKPCVTVEHGRRIDWHEQISLKFKQNDMEQMIPIDIRFYYPILTVNCDHLNFGTCFLEQTRQQELIVKNLTCSSSAWSIRKGISSRTVYLYMRQRRQKVK
jgi:hypothetical protein